MSSNYDDLRRHLEHTQKHARRRTLLATLIPVAAVIALVAVAGSRLITVNEKLNQANQALNKTNAKLNENLKQRDADIKKLTDRIGELESEKEKTEETLKSLRNQSTTRVQAARIIEQWIQTTATEQSPLVYLQIANEGQRDAARRVQSSLIQAGYVAPGIENAGRIKNAQIPKVAEVRYFRDEDVPEAERIADMLSRQGITATTGRASGKPEQERQFEIWFANDAPLKSE